MSKKVQHGTSGATIYHRVTQFYHRVPQFSLGYAILVPQVTNSAGVNLKYWVTLVPSGAGVVCHMKKKSRWKDRQQSDL